MCVVVVEIGLVVDYEVGLGLWVNSLVGLD